MIVLDKELVIAIYNTLIERPFKEVAGVAVPLFQQMNAQIQALEASVEKQVESNDTSTTKE